MKTVAALIGSLREGSLNRSIFEYYNNKIDKDFKFLEVKINNLPLYNEDLKDSKKVEEFCEKLSKADAFLFFSP